MIGFIAKQARHHAQNAYAAFCCKPADNHMRGFAFFSFSQLNDRRLWCPPSKADAESWSGWMVGGICLGLPIYLLVFVLALFASLLAWFFSGFALAHEWFSIKYNDLLANRIQWNDSSRWNALKVLLFRGRMHSLTHQLPGSNDHEKVSPLSALFSGFATLVMGLPGFVVGVVWGFVVTTLQGLYYGFRLGWVACFSHIGRPQCVLNEQHGWTGPFLGKLGFLPMFFVGLALAIVATNVVSLLFGWKHGRALLLDGQSPDLDKWLSIPRRFQWMTLNASKKFGYVRWVYACPGALVGGALALVWSAVVIGQAMVKDAMAYAFCSVGIQTANGGRVGLRFFHRETNAMRPYQERYGDWIWAWTIGLGLPVVAVTFVAATLYNVFEAAYLGAGTMNAILYSKQVLPAGAQLWRSYTALEHRQNLNEMRDHLAQDPSGLKRVKVFFRFKAVVGCLPFMFFTMARCVVYLIGSTITGLLEISFAALLAGLGLSMDRFKLSQRFFSSQLPRKCEDLVRYDHNQSSPLRWSLRLPGMVLGVIVGLFAFTISMALRLTKSLVWYLLAGLWAGLATFVLNIPVSSLADQARAEHFDWTGDYDPKNNYSGNQDKWWFRKLRQFRLHLFGRKSMAEQAADRVDHNGTGRTFRPGQHDALLEELHESNPIRCWMTPDYQWDCQLRDVEQVLLEGGKRAAARDRVMRSEYVSNAYPPIK